MFLLVPRWVKLQNKNEEFNLHTFLLVPRHIRPSSSFHSAPPSSLCGGSEFSLQIRELKQDTVRALCWTVWLYTAAISPPYLSLSTGMCDELIHSSPVSKQRLSWWVVTSVILTQSIYSPLDANFCCNTFLVRTCILAHLKKVQFCLTCCTDRRLNERIIVDMFVCLAADNDCKLNCPNVMNKVFWIWIYLYFVLN